MHVIENSVSDTRNRLLVDTVGDTKAGHEERLFRLVEIISGTDLIRDELDWLPETFRPFAIAPQALDIGGGGVVFPAQSEVDRQPLRRFPVVVKVEGHSLLAHIGERQSFRAIGCRGNAQQHGGVGIVCTGVTEVKGASRHVRGTTEEGNHAEFATKFESVRAEVHRDVITELMKAVVIKSVTSVLLGQALETGDIDVGESSFARGQFAIAVGDHAKGIEANRAEIET